MIAAVHYFSMLHLKMKIIYYKIHYHNFTMHNLDLEMNMTEALCYAETIHVFERERPN